jgi:hypothetical protein
MSRFDSIMRLLRILAVLALAVVLLLALDRISKIGEKSIFSRSTLKIDDTPVVLEKISDIGELATACYYDEDIYLTSKLTEITGPVGLIASAVGRNPSKDDLVIIARGTVKAGFDMGGVSLDDVTVRNDSLFVTLPRPKILSVTVNPSDYEIIGGNNSWSQREVSGLVDHARNMILKNALDNGIYSRAESSGKVKVREFLEACGFRNIVVSVAEE